MKDHKFFEVYLDNDLEKLYNYLYNLQEKMFYENILNIEENEKSKYSDFYGSSTQFGKYYNIFKFENDYIDNLKNNLAKLTVDACNYYQFDFDDQNYYIWGWFNLDKKTEASNIPISPIKDSKHFHDHSGGHGMPYLHGYYCVNAEPSSTFYMIDKDKEKVFENVNKNNRAILSETGHPHGRDDWHLDKPRVTIAYDITPKDKIEFGNIEDSLWIKL